MYLLSGLMPRLEDFSLGGVAVGLGGTRPTRVAVHSTDRDTPRPRLHCTLAAEARRCCSAWCEPRLQLECAAWGLELPARAQSCTSAVCLRYKRKGMKREANYLAWT